MTDADFMHLAVDQARQGIGAGQSPFGAVVVDGTRVLAGAHNTVWRDTDPTAHAEINAIRLAARQLGRIDLRGCVMFTTCEPCPMCLAGVHWSKIDRVVYGATIADAAAAGFCELTVPARDLARRGGSRVQIEGGVLSQECRRLFDEWRQAGLCKPY